MHKLFNTACACTYFCYKQGFSLAYTQNTRYTCCKQTGTVKTDSEPLGKNLPDLHLNSFDASRHVFCTTVPQRNSTEIKSFCFNSKDCLLTKRNIFVFELTDHTPKIPQHNKIHNLLFLMSNAFIVNLRKFTVSETQASSAFISSKMTLHLLFVFFFFLEIKKILHQSNSNSSSKCKV